MYLITQYGRTLLSIQEGSTAQPSLPPTPAPRVIVDNPVLDPHPRPVEFPNPIMRIAHENCEYSFLSFTDEDGNEIARVTALLSKQVLYFMFNVDNDSDLVRTFSPENYSSTEGWTFNNDVLDIGQSILPRINEWIYETQLRLRQSDASVAETVYGGAGIGGCMAVMAGYTSPPTAVVTFGMPAFCNNKIMEERYLQGSTKALKVYSLYVANDEYSYRPWFSKCKQLGTVRYIDGSTAIRRFFSSVFDKPVHSGQASIYHHYLSYFDSPTR